MAKKEVGKIKVISGFHVRNKHRGQYDFEQLIRNCPELKPHVYINDYKKQTIDFSDPQAVKCLNKALLFDFYGLEFWDIPEGYLCPPIPSRSDYVHHLADTLSIYNNGKIPRGNKLLGLDIGAGANCVYPIIGNQEYGWSFVGTEIDEQAIESAKRNISANKYLNGKIEIRKQKSVGCIFENIISEGEYFDFTVCNPPFHISAEEASKAASRKIKGLKKEGVGNIELNFGGKNNELWTKGGELEFIQNMIWEGKVFSDSVFLFSTLVSKKDNLGKIYDVLKKAEAKRVKTVDMNHGNKKSRIVFWTFLNKKKREAWANFRW